MKIKKLLSLFLAFTVSVTSVINCFAMTSDLDLESKSEDSFSDIVVPELLVSDDSLKIQIENIDQSIKEIDQLCKQAQSSDAKILELKAIYVQNKSELDELNKKYSQAIRERDDYKIKLDVQREISKSSEEDIMCKNCFCCRGPVSEVLSLLKREIVPTSKGCILRSKRFYKGMITGSVLVAVILVGVYVCIYYIPIPAIN